MARLLDISAIFACLLLAVASCSPELRPGQGVTLPEDATVLLLSAGSNGLEMSVDTKASSGNWIQQRIGMTNVAIAIYDHESGAKVYSGANFPFKLVDPAQPYQLAWLLGNFTPDPSKSYDLAFACNFPKTAKLYAFLETATWNAIVDAAPSSTTYQMPRDDMSNPSSVASAGGTDENFPVVTGYGNFGGSKSGADKDKMYVNMWRSPHMSGYIRDIKLRPGGVNLVGFAKNGADYVPAVSASAINSDLGTNYTAATLPPLYDASEEARDDSERILTVAPCYALLVVDNLYLDPSIQDKLTITDIFMMNVPMYHHLFANTSYYLPKSPDLYGNIISTVAYSKGKDLVSGFKQEWIDNKFRSLTAADDFARMLHYPADGKVSQSDFINNYTKADDSNCYNFKVKTTSQLLDRISISVDDKDGNKILNDFVADGRLTGNWAFLRSNFVLAYTTAEVRKALFFILSENGGEYPYETTLDEMGNRQYLFATRLVIRGKWKETPSSEDEVVYYPIVVNGPAQGFTIDNETSIPVEERSNFVHAGRRYIYSITLQSKGIYNPWAPARTPVTLGNIVLKVDNWISYDVELPKYIY